MREFRVTPGVGMPRALPAWQQKRLGERKKGPIKKLEDDEDQEEDLEHEAEEVEVEETEQETEHMRAKDVEDEDQESEKYAAWQGQAEKGEEAGGGERAKRPATMMEGVRAAREKMKREKEAKEEEARVQAEAETKLGIRKADSVIFNAEVGKRKEGVEELEQDWRKGFVSDEKGVDLDGMERMFRERMDKMKFSEEAEELLADWKGHIERKREERKRQVDNTEALAEAAKIAELGEEEWRERTRREEEAQEQERQEVVMKRRKKEEAPLQLEEEEEMRQRVLEEHASYFADERPRNRKDKRRKVVQKAINHHLSLALHKKQVMKTRPDLEYLAELVTLTDVVLSDDMSHARLVWAAHVEMSPEREKKVNADLTELLPAFRYTIAKGLNLRRCPSLSVRPDLVALSSLRVEGAMHEHHARLSAMGINAEDFGFGGGGGGGVGSGEKEEGAAGTLGFDPDKALAEMERRIEEFNLLSAQAPPSPPSKPSPPSSSSAATTPRVNNPPPRSTSVEARVKRLLAQIQDDEPPAADTASDPGRPAP